MVKVILETRDASSAQHLISTFLLHWSTSHDNRHVVTYNVPVIGFPQISHVTTFQKRRISGSRRYYCNPIAFSAICQLYHGYQAKWGKQHIQRQFNELEINDRENRMDNSKTRATLDTRHRNKITVILSQAR